MNLPDEIELTPENNANIVLLLKLAAISNPVYKYAAKLIESLQEENRDLKAKLNYIKNGSSEMFIPPPGENLD